MSSRALSRMQLVAGMTTLTAMLLALLLDNSPARAWYDLIHHMPVSVHVGAFAIDKPLIFWINEGLMVFFFLLIALELKREVLEGQLATPRANATPGFATQGGRSFSPLRDTEQALHPWVALGVVPIFAFFNSGIVLSLSSANALGSPISLGIALVLFAGKPLDIFDATWLAVRLGVAQLPEAAS